MKLISVPLCALLLTPAVSAQTTWYVDASAAPPGYGTQAAPYSSIQHAIAQAGTLDGDTLEVAPGTYFESLELLGKALHLVAPQGPSVTILDGSSLRSVVRFVAGEGPTTVLEGFTVRNGAGEMLDSNYPTLVYGGGIFCDGASPTIRGCTIQGNGWETMYQPKADGGGGLYIRDGSPAIEDCVIEGNGCWQSGGGLQIVGESSPHISDTAIWGNRVGGYFYGWLFGGGVFFSPSVVGSTALLERCVVSYNAATRGGGIYGPVEAYDCEISGNEGVLGGGALYAARLERCTLSGNRCEYDNVYNYAAEGGAAHTSHLVDCTIEHNRAGFGGGVAQCTVEGSRLANNGATDPSYNTFDMRGGAAFDSTLVDCELVGNWTEESGYPEPIDFCGGALAGGSATRCVIRGNIADEGGAADGSTLVHCTVVGNVGREDSGGLRGGSATNSIVWGNNRNLGGGATTTWCLVGGGSSGVGDFDGDPKLWNPVAGDCELMSSSPCIDAGDPGAPLDPDGSRADIGALPYDAAHVGQPLAYCTAKTTAAGCVPAMGSTGTPSFGGADDFDVTAIHVRPSSLGFVFWGRASLAAPFQGGFRCVASPFVRMPAASSAGATACAGVIQKHFSHAYWLAAGLAPSDTLYVQAWFRDPAHPDGTGVGITDALEFSLTP